MAKLSVGEPLPGLTIHATGGKIFNLGDLKGKGVVLYFYPKDNTPGCTAEGQDFRDRYAEFLRRRVAILGVSCDSLASHEKFKARHRFPFDLISDEDQRLCKTFGVFKEKSLYGRKHLGIDRSTFIFDKDGILRKEFRGVKVKGHVDQILEELKKL